MYLVLGNIPRGVELRDLKDFVYYKQQKVYTEAQYNSSRDLQREIKSGALTVLKKTDEKSGSFDIPSFGIASGPLAPTYPKDDSQINALQERIDLLEKSLSERSSAVVTQTNSINEETLRILVEAIKRLEDKIANISLEAKLEDFLKRATTIVSASSVEDKKPNHEEVTQEEIYVPNVVVEDGRSHIKLDMRTIDIGDSVSDSLKKLRDLKSKSK